MININISIYKDQITEFGKLKGVSNSHTLTLPDGSSISPGKVIFLGFRGRFNIEAQVYDGIFVFDTEVPRGTHREDLRVLFEDGVTDLADEMIQTLETEWTEGINQKEVKNVSNDDSN